MKKTAYLLFFTFLTLFFANCKQPRTPKCRFNHEDKSYHIDLQKNNDTSFVIVATTFRNDSILLVSEWPLDYPVFHFECGDVNNDKLPDILAGVEKTTRFDSTVRRRIFIFKLFQGYVRPLWLGSRVSQPLEQFRFVEMPETANCIRTIEFEKDSTFLVAEYRWRGFGLEFVRYLQRNASLETARKIFRQK